MSVFCFCFLILDIRCNVGKSIREQKLNVSFYNPLILTHIENAGMYKLNNIEDFTHSKCI